MSFDYEIIGKRIKKCREDEGYTQEQLAEFLDVSNAYISKIERGKTSINLNTLATICEYLKVTPSFILTGATCASDNYLRNEITELLEGCPPDKVKLILDVIKPIIKYQKK